MSKVVVKILNAEGIEKFKEFINKIKLGIVDKHTVCEDLSAERYSKEFIDGQIEIDKDLTFNNRLELAEYLTNTLNSFNVDINQINALSEEDRKGLFSWFSYVWFEQLTNERKSIGRIPRYILSDVWNRWYVHLVAGAYFLYNTNIQKKHLKLFLYTPVYKISDFIDHLISYNFIVSSNNLVETAYKLYWDEENNKPKKNSTGDGTPGNVRRFTTVINQLRLTFDIFNKSSEQILELLPEEFNLWKLN